MLSVKSNTQEKIFTFSCGLFVKDIYYWSLQYGYCI